jgi:hypothetical protein
MLDNILQRFGSLPTVGTATATSMTGATVSFMERTLPVVSWLAAFVALVSGMLGIVLACRSLCRGHDKK